MTPTELRARRLALGLTQAQLAILLDVARNTVTRWELGTMAIRHPQLVLAQLEKLQAGSEAVELHGGGELENLSRHFATRAELYCWADAYLAARRRELTDRQAIALADEALAQLID